MVAKETEEVTCAGYQELKERLQLLQPHMQASTCCWDDTLAQVNRMLRRVSNRPGQRSSSQPITTPWVFCETSNVTKSLYSGPKCMYYLGSPFYVFRRAYSLLMM